MDESQLSGHSLRQDPTVAASHTAFNQGMSIALALQGSPEPHPSVCVVLSCWHELQSPLCPASLFCPLLSARSASRPWPLSTWVSRRHICLRKSTGELPRESMHTEWELSLFLLLRCWLFTVLKCSFSKVKVKLSI